MEGTQEVDVATTTEQTQESKEPTVSDLLKRIEEAERKAEEKDKGFRTLQQKYDRLYKTKETPLSTSNINKKILDEIEQLSKDDQSSQARIQALKNEAARLEREESTRLQIEKQQRIADEKRAELEDKIRAKGEDPEDDKYDSVWTAWELSSLADGKFERAENKLDRILSKKPVEKEVKPVENEDQMRARIERELLEKHGLLKKDEAKPSGFKSNDFKDIEKGYVEGTVSKEDYMKARKERGL